jgi:hypothetical protein
VSVAGTGQTVTISPVATSNTFSFSPALTIAASATVSFTVTAETSNTVAAITTRVYAALMGGEDKHYGAGPLGGGLLMMLIALALIPISNPLRRRRVLSMSMAGLALIVLLAGCGGSGGGSHPSSTGTAATVFGNGTLSNEVHLATVTVKGATSSVTTVLRVTGVSFE